MKALCERCKKFKDGVSPKIVGYEYIAPEPPLTKKQLIAIRLAVCESCYEKHYSIKE